MAHAIERPSLPTNSVGGAGPTLGRAQPQTRGA